MSSEKILFVDDEAAVLDGYKRLLHKEFTIWTAVGGDIGLEILKSSGPFAVVVSDMKMPGMNGIEFLSRVRQLSPDTVRIMLTGFADINSAISAVNEGAIFRFFTKPSDKETLTKSLIAALEQHRLITAEKVLLEQTLLGSVKVLAEVLSVVNPAAFGRAMRIRRYVKHIVEKRRMPNAWRFEIAATLSQLGCIILDADSVEAAYLGRSLSPDQQTKYNQHPTITRDLLANIPRMEQIAWMIEHQNDVPKSDDAVINDETREAYFGARMLKVTLAYDQFISRGFSHLDSLREVRALCTVAEQSILSCMSDMEPERGAERVIDCPIRNLRSNMVLHQDVRSTGGALLLTKGQDITYSVLMALKSYMQRGIIADSVLVTMNM